MLWLVILGIVALMFIVLMHKRPVNNAGITYVPQPHKAPPKSEALPPAAIIVQIAPPPAPVSMDFNDIFKSPTIPPPVRDDRPHA